MTAAKPTPVVAVAAAWLAAAAVLGWAVAEAVHAAGEPGVDARLRWQELRYTLRGVDPIDVATGAVPPDADIGPLAPLAGYPPWSYLFAIVFLPPAAWPVPFVWFALLHLPALVAIAYVGWEAGARLAPADARLRQMSAAAALVTGSIPVCLHYGNYGVVLMGLLVAAFAADRAGRPVAAGLCWGLAMVKPQVAIFYGLVLLLRRAWLALAVGGVVVASAWAAASYLIGKPPLVLVKEMGEQSARHVGGLAGGFQGLQEVLLYAGVPAGAMLALGFALAAAFIVWLGRVPRPAALAAALIVPGVVIPLFVHHRTHDLMIQSPLIALLAVHCLWRAQEGAVAGAAADLLLLALLIAPVPYRVTQDIPMAHVPWRLAAAAGLVRVWPLVRTLSGGVPCPTP